MKIDWLLISKSLEGKLTPREQSQLQQWLDESVKHRQFIEDLQTYTDTRDSRKDHYINDFERRINAVHARKTLLARRKKRLTAIIGAAVIISTALLLVYPGSHNAPPSKRVAELRDSAQVTLIVDNQIIALNQATDTISDNIVNNNGQITYNESEQVEAKINKLIVPKCMEYSVKLCDGTVVWLNAASELTYPDRFTQTERRVTLKGEAYFEVAKDSKREFIVDAQGVDINVYGTQFNVNTHNQDIEVVLVEGSIALKHGDSPEIEMKPNQLALYNKESSVVVVKSVDVMNHIAWRHGEYRFEDEKLSKILSDLALWYDIDIKYSNLYLKDLVFTCYLPKAQDITELLKHIEKTSYVKFELKDKLLIVK